MAEVILRQMVDGDRAFILDSAWRSIRSHPATEQCTAAQLGRLMSPLLDSWQTLVAADVGAPDMILGWLCHRASNAVAWAYVKPWARGKGVLRALLADAGIGAQFECVFPVATRLRSLSPRWRPYLALGVT